MNNRKIKMFVTLYENLLILQRSLIEYLSAILPSIYGIDWWAVSVVDAFNTTVRDNGLVQQLG